jgi:hypothetical protein
MYQQYPDFFWQWTAATTNSLWSAQQTSAETLSATMSGSLNQAKRRSAMDSTLDDDNNGLGTFMVPGTRLN